DARGHEPIRDPERLLPTTILKVDVPVLALPALAGHVAAPKLELAEADNHYVVGHRRCSYSDRDVKVLASQSHSDHETTPRGDAGRGDRDFFSSVARSLND